MRDQLHKHIRTEEFYFVLEGVGRRRVSAGTLKVPKYSSVHQTRLGDANTAGALLSSVPSAVKPNFGF
jgi:hypothetical protein